MRLNKNYAGIPYLYRKNGAVSTVMEITMKDDVDGSQLQAAVNFTVARHPYFKSSMLEEHGDFYIAENEMPFIVTETKERRCLGSRELNFHMIDVTYFGKQISVAFHHALCDGAGAKRFTETLLCYYCEFKYQDSVEQGDGILPQPGDILDPFGYGMYKVENVEMPNVIKDGYALPEVPDSVSDDMDYMYSFILDNDSFMKFAKENHATPAILVALLMSEAIQSIHEDAEKPIVCSMASDLRQGLNAKTTLKNAVNSIYLPYDKDFAKKSLAEKADQYREIIKEQKEENYVKTCANGMVYLFSKLDEMKSLEEKRAVMAAFDNIKINTYILSYAGRLDLYEAERYVESIQLYSGGNNGLFINMMSVGTTISVNILQSFENEVYVKNFEKLLRKTGIQFKVSEKIQFTTPRDRIAETPALESVRKEIDTYAYVRSLSEHENLDN